MPTDASSAADRAPVTVVVLTFNEERNIEACLRSVQTWASDVFVVDSGSTDRTTEVAEAYGARVAGHAFETHARQWRWALETLPIQTRWVLGIDADQRVTPELVAEITTVLGALNDEVAGFYMPRRQIFRGRWIRHGGYYPKYLLKLFDRTRVVLDADELVDHHFQVTGATRLLRADLIEDNQNEAEIAVWTAKHNRYAVLQANQEVAERRRIAANGAGALFGTPDARTLWLKRRWAALPLFVRPCLYVFYRYFVRLGFLDGKQGFIFHVLQAFWYRLLVDVNIDEIRSRENSLEAVRHGRRLHVDDHRPEVARK